MTASRWRGLCHLGPLLITWITWIFFNPINDNLSHPWQNNGLNYLFIPKHQRCNRWSLGMNKYFYPTLHWAYDYLSMLGLKLIHVSLQGFIGMASFDVRVSIHWAVRHFITGFREITKPHTHTHIWNIISCILQHLHRFKRLLPSDAVWRYITWSKLVQVVVC